VARAIDSADARRAALALAFAALACSSERPAGYDLVRLTPRLGPPQMLRSEREARPGVTLALDEPRVCRIEAGAGSWLHFALLAQGRPRLGLLELRVLANRRPLLRRRFELQRRMRSWPIALPLDVPGEVELSFEVRLVEARGAAAPVPPPDRPPRVALGSPRVYAPKPSAARRVLIWLSQDSLRADHLGAYGYRRATSPVFDRLAETGVLFENAMAPASWTLPSMTSQFTSRYPSYHGGTIVGRVRDQRHPTLFEALADAGFTVLGVSGNRFVSQEFGTASGFDALWFAKAGADALNRLALEALDEWRGGDLALLVHYRDPHFPYEPPPPHDRFDPDYAGPANGRNFESFGPAQAAEVAHVRALYDAEIAANDAQIGVLLAALRERGLLEDALLIYSSDHGEEFLEHGGWTHSRTLYQELLHVPLLLRLPEGRARRVRDPVSLLDVAPTVLDAFGLPAPPSFQGRSLLPLARGASREARPIFAETEHGLDKRHRVAVRDGPLKYLLVLPPSPAPPVVVAEQLFDLAADPGEQRPLPPSPAHARLRGEALAFLARARAEGGFGTDAAPLEADTLRQLRALGYVE
jgi:arylsulfatase A-like enzyme